METKNAHDKQITARPAASLARAGASSMEWVVCISLVLFLAAFGHAGQTYMASIAAISCIVVLGMLRFGSIGKLEALGLMKIENATREAHQATEEARVTVEQLKTLSAVLGKLALDQAALRNRLGVLSPRALKVIRDRVVEALRVNACSDEDIGKATVLMDNAIRRGMAERIGDAVNRKDRERKDDGISAASQKLMNVGRRLAPAAASSFRAALSGHEVLDHEVEALLKQYETYERTGEIPSFADDDNYFADEMVE